MKIVGLRCMLEQIEKVLFRKFEVLLTCLKLEDFAVDEDRGTTLNISEVVQIVCFWCCPK